MNLQEQADPTSQATLESWKEIAAYLRRDAKTARKWEKEEGLPVHRHTHKSRSSVYAYPGEIDRWRATRKVVTEPAPPVPMWRRLLTPTFAVTLAACLVMVGNGVRPRVAEAGQIRTLICSGADCDGTISPDGKLLVVSMNGGLPIRDLATKKLKLLWEATPGMQAGSCCTEFSPDGSRVAYSRRPDGPFTQEKRAAEEVIVVNIDGTKSHAVYRGGASYAWSADGKRLLVEANTTNLLWVDIATGAVQKLPTTHANIDAAKVSPDGKYVAFNASKDEDAEENVYIMASDGTGETLVSPSAAYQEPIEWTPDGKYLVYAQFGASVSLWAAPISNGKLQGPVSNMHTEFERGARLLGNDRSGAVYYRTVSSGSDIYTAALDPATGKVTSAQIPVPVPGGSVGKIVLPRWAPDSRRLAYMHLSPEREMYVYSFATAKEQRIAPQAQLPSAEHCWSRDGSSVFVRNGVQAVRFDLTSSQMTPMFSGTTEFNFANCSGDLVVRRTATGITVRELGTSSEKEIYRSTQNSGTLAPAISHDGRDVAFVTPGVGAPAAGVSAIHVVSSDGGPVRDLVSANSPAQLQPYWGVAWSPDDRFVYFARRANDKAPYELMRVPAAGGTAESMGLKVDDLRDLDIAPDGTRIVFSIGAVNRPEIWALRGFLPARK